MSSADTNHNKDAEPGAKLRGRVVAVGQWLIIGSVVGLFCGCASALLLSLLERATDFRGNHEWLVFCLPVAGFLIGWLYQRFGSPVKGGTNLVIDTIHDDGPEVPLRMAPMVLGGTVLTHLFGGSAGREGTAVQVGASLTDWLSHRLKLPRALRLQLLVAGVAGGFGAVFGTPIAGMVFGLEFVTHGRLKYEALVPALVAAVVGDAITRAWGIHHTVYPWSPQANISILIFAKWLVFAVAVAATATLFIELTHFVKRLGERYMSSMAWRMAVGGIAVVVLWQLVGNSDYLGLSVPLIERAFHDPNLPLYAFALKLLFTAITLGAGFLGGEVTPLFVIGATLGSVLAGLLSLPIALGAAVGLAAMFATASKTPLALSIMAVEMFGAAILPHVAVVCAVASMLTGNRSIYSAQRVTKTVLNGGSVSTPLRDLSRSHSPPGGLGGVDS